MGLEINTNIPALGAARETRQASNLLARNLEQLGSGLRITGAASDPAGFAIAERFNTLARQSRVEVNNLQSGVNLAQTAEGGLEAQQGAVQRIRELAVQASNGTLTDDQRQALNEEAQQLVQQVDDVAEDTEFNGRQVLNEDQTVDLGTEGDVEVTLNESTAASLGIDSIDLSSEAGAAAAVDQADQALNRISQDRASLGAQVSRFERGIEQREIAGINAFDAESRIRDLDIARAATEQARNEVLLQGGLAAIAQSNVTPQAALQLLGT